MKEKLVRFHLYRYQILPINRYFQADLYGAKTVEELIAKKNEIFQETLNSNAAFKSTRSVTRTQKLFERDDFTLYRVAASRLLNHEKSDFETEVIDNWPKILVAVWNKPDKQLIAVQHRYAAFQSTDAFIKLMFNSIETLLANSQLTAISEPLFEKHVFWDLVEKILAEFRRLNLKLLHLIWQIFQALYLRI